MRQVAGRERMSLVGGAHKVNNRVLAPGKDRAYLMRPEDADAIFV